ncbi:MAG: NAD(P)-binding protein, partial [Candidatus Micrarchaeota archaeon]
MKEYELAIIGGGPAGLAAGVYAGRRTLKTAIFETALPGGSMNWTTDIDNYPGFTHSTGMEISAKMKEHAEAAGAEIINEEVM